MDLKITPRRLSGAILPPPSKSQAHRLIIGAALAKGESQLERVALSQDILATIRCMRALGADISSDGSLVRGVEEMGPKPGCLPALACGESGSTLRFLIPLSLAVQKGGVFTGAERLMERPLGPYEALFAEKGITFTRERGMLRVEGQLTAGNYHIPGNISSQFITGLLYALPLLHGDSEIMLTTPLESSGYVDMTLDALHRFGITVESTPRGWWIPGDQTYRTVSCRVEPDYSQAAFFYAAALLGNAVVVEGMPHDSKQGDRVILDQMEMLKQTGTVSIDVRECPDLVPPLAAAAAFRVGESTHITGAARLRIKESDRLRTVTQQLNRLGCRITEGGDSLHIVGVPRISGGTVSGCNDHRIAMMLAIAATRGEGDLLLRGAECVEKSYPEFWEDYVTLGGKIERMG